ncbi:MAG: lytic transglycosylase domain-containing protein, partial [Roseicyclus sp.]
MRRLLLATCLFLWPAAVLADAEALGRAIDAALRGDAAVVSEAVARLDDPIARDLVEWTRLRRGGAEFADYVTFLERNPDWPGLPY